MIKNSFIVLKGIKTNSEKQLWSYGIKDWDNFIAANKIKGISKNRKLKYDLELKECKKRYLENDIELYLKFPSRESWRLYGHLKDEAVFIDIEIGKNREDIILIGLYNGFETKTMVKNYNLDKNIFQNELKKYKLIITYNGKSFDIPAIEKYFGIKINIPHIDLKHCCLNLGLNGGLKEIEKKLNIKRPINLYDTPFDSYKAFMASGDKEYLELLIKYNEEDMINLKPIMEYCYNKLKINL